MEVVETKTFMMMPAKPGLCEVCAFDHAEHLAHNIQSMAYQVGFKLRWGRFPTWADACAHLTVSQREAWRTAMEGKAEWTEPIEGEPIAEPYAKATYEEAKLAEAAT